MVQELKSVEEFEELIKGDSIVLIDFWAEWCGPCRIFAPVFEKVSEDYKDVKFVKVNVDKFPEIAARFGVSSIPTLLAVHNGNIINHAIGALPEPMLKEFVENCKESLDNK